MISSTLTLPPLVIDVDGSTIEAGWLDCLSEMRIRRRLSSPSQCELVFSAAPSSLIEVMRHGAALDVRLAGESQGLFAGEITALELGCGPARGRALRVRGYDRLHRLRKQQPVRAHVGVGVEDLVRELVQGLGLTLNSADSVDGWRWRRLIQHGQTNLELLQEVTAACGLFYSLEGDELRLMSLQGEGTPVALTLGEDLLEAQLEANSERTASSVSVSGWDPLRVERCSGQAGDPQIGRSVGFEISPDNDSGTTERLLPPRAIENDRQAQSLAQADLDRCTARALTIWGVTDGNAKLCPGTRVDVDGLGAGFDGIYVLSEVTHTLSRDQGFMTEISSTPPPLDSHREGGSIMLGVVARVDDPEQLGRVQVSFPMLGGVESDWTQVLLPAAGVNKGLVMLPDVGDHVAVWCNPDNPSLALVLGGLYGQDGPPDAGVEDGVVKRYTFQTPGGQRIRLDDGRGLVRLENKDGSYVELTPNRVSIRARADMRIDAPGHVVTIAGKAIRFEEA